MNSKKIIKETIIMLLTCLVTMLIFAIVLYKFIPNRKTVAEVKEYKASESVQTLLEDNVDSGDKSEVILSYEVTSRDLNNYQKTNAYVPGKQNPFAAASSSAYTGDNSGDNGNANTNSGTTNSGSNNNNQSNSGYFKDTGTK